MVMIEVGQGVARACHHDGFHDLGTFHEAPGTVQSPGVCADASAPSGPLLDLQHCASFLRGSKILFF